MTADPDSVSENGEQYGTEHDSIIQTAEFRKLVELDAELFGAGESHDEDF